MNDVTCMAASSCSKEDEKTLVDEYFKVCALTSASCLCFPNLKIRRFHINKNSSLSLLDAFMSDFGTKNHFRLPYYNFQGMQHSQNKVSSCGIMSTTQKGA